MKPISRAKLSLRAKSSLIRVDVATTAQCTCSWNAQPICSTARRSSSFTLSRVLFPQNLPLASFQRSTTLSLPHTGGSTLPPGKHELDPSRIYSCIFFSSCFLSCSLQHIHTPSITRTSIRSAVHSLDTTSRSQTSLANHHTLLAMAFKLLLTGLAVLHTVTAQQGIPTCLVSSPTSLSPASNHQLTPIPASLPDKSRHQSLR
jgi:hypothetical protein